MPVESELQMAQPKERHTDEIPEFQNEAEAAAFWDNHSALDYPDHFQAAEVQFSRPLIKRGLMVDLGEEALSQLHALAEARGISASTLARAWILERIEIKGHAILPENQ